MCKRMCAMFILTLMGHILNHIFEMKNKTNAYELSLELKMFLRSEMKKKLKLIEK